MQNVEAPESRLLYRVLEGRTATMRDFMSKAALGEPLRLPHTAKRRRLHEGLSLYASLEAARDRAQRFRPPPTHVAAVAVPLNGSIPFEQTGIDPEHFTVWAAPATLLELVTSTVEVEPLAGDEQSR